MMTVASFCFILLVIYASIEQVHPEECQDLAVQPCRATDCDSATLRYFCAETCDLCDEFSLRRISWADETHLMDEIHFPFGKCPRPAAPLADLHSTFVDDSLRFAWDVYRLVADAQPHRNFAFSPATLRFALAQLQQAASERARAEIQRKAFGSEHSDDDIEAKEVTMLRYLRQESNGFAGTALVIDSSVRTDNDYRQLSFSCFKSPIIATADFAHNKPNVARIMTRTIASQTKQRVADMSDNARHMDGPLVMGAGYSFEAPWSVQPMRQVNSYFNSSRREQQDGVTGLHVFSALPYAHDGAARLRVVCLPFGKDGRQSLCLLMPDGQRRRLGDVIRDLQPERLQRTLDKTKLRSVHVFLPEFRVDRTLLMKPFLRDLGIRRLFDNSDSLEKGFTSRDSDIRVALRQLYHRASFEINVEGAGPIRGLKKQNFTELRAFYSSRVHDVVLMVRRPFAYLIRDAITGEILLIGQLVHIE